MTALSAGADATGPGRPRTVFITGATGFLGSHIAASLLGDGVPVLLLCRGREHVTAAQRIAAVMAWHGVTNLSLIEVIDGDIGKPLLGLSPTAFQDVANRISEIIHCASNTSFARRDDAQLERVNIEGTRNVLGLAGAGSCSLLHYISTVYTAGKRRGTCYERVEPAVDYCNFYEYSKAKAEELIVNAGRATGMRVAIYRPSIVIGDSVTGKTLIFNGMYYPIRVVAYLKEMLMKDFASHSGNSATKLGVAIRDDGSLFLPIRIQELCRDGAGLNIVPIDYVTQAIRAIMRHAADIGVYHIVNREPISLVRLAEFTQRFFQISGIDVCSAPAFSEQPMNTLERHFDSLTKAYRPYMGDERRFDTTNTDAVLEQYHLACVPVDYGLVEKCLLYAVESGWKNPLSSG